MRYKLPAALNIGIDMDSRVIEKWRSAAAVRNGDSAGGVALPGGESGKDGGRRRSSREIAPPDPATQPAGRNRYWFHQGDAISFLEGYPFTGAELVYADPPYVRSTCTSRCRYAFDLDDDGHRRLLQRLIRIPGPVLISGYDSPLYRELLTHPRWNHITFRAMTRRGPRIESLWFNFPPPTQLHDDRYIGGNRREREYLKRQKDRWVARLAKMEPLKKRALLAAIATAAE